MTTSVIAIDGVLRKMMGQPIPEGLALYRGLTSVGRVILLDDSDDYGRTADWLELNGCVNHEFVNIIDGSHVDRANAMRREGYDVTVVVESNPETAMEMIGAGFTTLVFTHAMYTRPDWRPDNPKGIKPWTDIVDAVAQSAKMKAADVRLRSGD